MSEIETEKPPYDGERVLIGLSAGINSAAVLCWLKEIGANPAELHLFYAHFKEHSPDSFRFVADCIRFARKHFSSVKVKITRNSIIDYFEQQNLIPHPSVSPCSKILKVQAINIYAFENNLKIDLVGYVKHELKKRSERQQKHIQVDLFSLHKHYPIGSFTDNWCFQIVDRNIGWHPAIYDIKDENGKRVFKHNNCLPCKNMYPQDIEAVKEHYPQEYQNAMDLSARLNKHWGRNADEFYTTFGRDLGQDTTCETCRF